MSATFYAITGVGWGRGDSPDEAIDAYRQAMRRDWPKTWKQVVDGPDASWGFVWEAPEGATGFYLDGRLIWTGPDGFHQEAEADQKRVDVGPVPARWSVSAG